MSFLIGLDIGTTSVKTGIFDASGRQVAAAAHDYRIDHPKPDWAEIDPEIYWQAAVTTVRHALRIGSVEPGRVTAIGVSSQGETVIPVDAAGRALGRAVVWLDNRARTEARLLAGQFSDQEVYERTGVPSISPTWTACKLLWWRRHEPGLFAATYRFMLVEDFILQRLTGRFVTDRGVQSTTLLYDIGRQGWWEPMLDAVGIGPERLSELVQPGAVVGELSAAAADALGLPRVVRVVVGGMDQGAGAVGVGNIAPGMISESTGGALALQATIADPGLDPTRLTPVYVHSVPGQYIYCPVCPTGGMALTWFRDQFGAVEVERAAVEGRNAFDLLTDLAAGVQPGAEGLTMLPHLMGAFSPEYEPEARGAYYGFTLHHGRPHFVRAVLEAVAFMLRRNIELLAGARALATEVRSHGGGARSSLWNQIKADVTGLTVLTLAGEDAAVRGDAMIAGVAAGTYPDLQAASGAMVMLADRYVANPLNRPAYDAAYERYIELFNALRPMYKRAGAAG
jgi:xylulokinase